MLSLFFFSRLSYVDTCMNPKVMGRGDADFLVVCFFLHGILATTDPSGGADAPTIVGRNEAVF
jgi:hypothetical protein